MFFEHFHNTHGEISALWALAQYPASTYFGLARVIWLRWRIYVYR